MLLCKLHLAEISTDIKLLQTYFDISNTFEASSMVLEPSSGVMQHKETGTSSLLVKKRQISSYCRHILTFPAHLNFISRSLSSMVHETSMGASSMKKQGTSLLSLA